MCALRAASSQTSPSLSFDAETVHELIPHLARNDHRINAPRTSFERKAYDPGSLGGIYQKKVFSDRLRASFLVCVSKKLFSDLLLFVLFLYPLLIIFISILWRFECL